jgi:RNA polymerase sigma factor for flagellar operon FliA
MTAFPSLTALVRRHLAPVLRLLEPAAHQELVGAAIDALPERDRIVLALYYDHGLTMPEIAAVLEVTPRTLHALARQLVRRLRSRVLYQLEVHV